LILLVQYIYFYASAKRIQRSQLKISAQANNFKHYQGFKKSQIQLSKKSYNTKETIGTISHDIQSPLKYIQVIAKHLIDNPQQDPLIQNTFISFTNPTQLQMILQRI
jgi:light-regulated signal transduction histidine kinase (bacteriophytochrome)